MSGLFSKPKAPKIPEPDRSAEIQAREMAAAEEARKQAIEAENAAKKRNVKASGRTSHILAGENDGTTLGG